MSISTCALYIVNLLSDYSGTLPPPPFVERFWTYLCLRTELTSVISGYLRIKATPPHTRSCHLCRGGRYSFFFCGCVYFLHCLLESCSLVSRVSNADAVGCAVVGVVFRVCCSVCCVFHVQ